MSTSNATTLSTTRTALASVPTTTMPYTSGQEGDEGWCRRIGRRVARIVTWRIAALALVCALALVGASGCSSDGAKMPDGELAAALDTAHAYERYRPLVHFTPERGWMNDPNGLVYADGRYHLYYQHYPDSTVWGPMHWGHAVSPDLVHWTHAPIALAPVDSHFVFSGSVVYDSANTSGFGRDGRAPLVALFTDHDMRAERLGATDYETQALAFSLDGGTTWTRYDANPVVPNPGLKDFRDPKVTWHAPTRRWVMALAARDHVKFFTSPDLKAWTFASDFGRGLGSHGGIWECPDLFRIVETASERERYVLLVSVQDGAPAGGTGTSYFVGDFDGTHFRAEAGAADALWLDQGADNYAFVTFDHAPVPATERLGIGWMSNWQYAQVVPATTWRSAMTTARRLTLHATADGPRLRSEPVAGYAGLRAASQPVAHTGSAAATGLGADLSGGLTGPFELAIATPVGRVPEFSVVLVEGRDSVVFGATAGDFFVDRRGITGAGTWHPGFAERHTLANHHWAKADTLRILVDETSVEIFGDGGFAVLTDTYFLNGPRRDVRLRSAAAVTGRVYRLTPARVLADARATASQ